MSSFSLLSLFIYFIAGYDATDHNIDVELDQLDVFYCGGSSNVQIPSEYFNDNYCDCMETGNDEPYTSACNNGKFFCEIDNKYIHSSLVNDGIICDCSDGSDEWAFDSKCDKYHNKIKNIQNDFDLFSQVINSIKHVYANILFPSYIVSRSQHNGNNGNNGNNENNQNNAHNYENIKDVQQFLRKKKQTKNVKYRRNKREESLTFPYNNNNNNNNNNNKYKPPANNKELIDDELMEIINQVHTPDSSPYPKLTLFFVIVLSLSVMIGYIVKFKYLDKSKQH